MLIVFNDIENQIDIVTVIPITSRKLKRKIYPNELLITLQNKEAIFLCHQIRTLSKARLDKKMGSLDVEYRSNVVDVLCMRFRVK